MHTYLADKIIAQYIGKAAIPCNDPAAFVLTCQLEPEIENILRHARDEFQGRSDTDRSLFYKNKLKPEIESLANPNRKHPGQRGPGSPENALQIARNILNLNESGDAIKPE